MFDSQVNDKYKTGRICFSKSITSVPVVETSKVKTSESKPKSVGEPLIEDWISDSEDEDEDETEFNNFNEKVNTVRRNVTNVGPKAVVSDNKGNETNVVKASACWVWRPKQKVVDHVSRHNGNPQLELQEKGVIDSGCSRHMTRNQSYLSDYEEIDGRFVAFGGDPKGGKINGKGKISTGKLDFEDVYFVKELKFNLFSVSQMCDKKNSVLFTNTECVVLSPDFKLLDKNHVLLRVPRKDNMYSVDLKNIVPSRDLTYIFVKATLDESNLWHRRWKRISEKRTKIEAKTDKTEHGNEKSVMKSNVKFKKSSKVKVK
ncbi:hypothetical protein Tco_0150704 [Tanacetum coccineum]